MQRQSTVRTDPFEFICYFAINMDLPIESGQRCEIVRLIELDPWQAVTGVDRTRLSLA